MKKLIFLVIVLTILISSCSFNDDNIANQLEGKYYYKECIYLTFFSSSSLFGYASRIHIEFSDDQIVYYGNGELTRIYNNIEFKEEGIYKDLDQMFTLDFDGVFETFKYRYDI